GVRGQAVQAVRATEFLQVDGDGAGGEVDRDELVLVDERRLQEGRLRALKSSVEPVDSDSTAAGLDRHDSEVGVDRNVVRDRAEDSFGTNSRVQRGADAIDRLAETAREA